MKKSDAILIIVCIALIVVGTLLAITGLSMGAGSGYSLDWENGFKISYQSGDVVELDKVSIPNEVKNINVEYDFGKLMSQTNNMTNIEIVHGNEFAVSFIGNDNITTKFDYEIVDDTINIYITETEGKLLFDFTLFTDYESEVIITIPSSQSLDSVTLSANVQDVEIKNIFATTLDIQSDVGNIEIEDSTFLNTAIIADVGNIEIDNSNLGIADITSDIGDIDLDSCRVESLVCVADIGNVEISLVGNADEYTVFAKAELGDVVVDKNMLVGINDDAKQIYIDANIGNVDVRLER